MQELSLLEREIRFRKQMYGDNGGVRPNWYDKIDETDKIGYFAVANKQTWTSYFGAEVVAEDEVEILKLKEFRYSTIYCLLYRPKDKNLERFTDFLTVRKFTDAWCVLTRKMQVEAMADCVAHRIEIAQAMDDRLTETRHKKQSRLCHIAKNKYDIDRLLKVVN